MTGYLKKILHDLGLLYVTIHELEKQHTKDKRIFFEDYNESLGELLPGEPAIIVKISENGDSKIFDYQEKEGSISTDKENNNISILELPEDEFYFFEAFRLGIFNITQELPAFIFNMWIIHTYGLFENYLIQILKERFSLHPKLLGINKTITIQELLDSKSKEEILEKKIDFEIRDIMYLPIVGILEKLRAKLGFKKLPYDFDIQVKKISLIRNCLVHNGARVDIKLANEFPIEYEHNERIILNNKDVGESIYVIRKLSYEIDKIFRNIKKDIVP